MARTRRQIPLFEVLRSEDSQVGAPPKAVVPVNGAPDVPRPETPTPADGGGSSAIEAPEAPASEEASATSEPEVVVSPSVTPAAPTPVREASSSGRAPASVLDTASQGRVYHVSATMAYMGIALIIVLLSITWVVGYARGNEEGKGKAAEEAEPKTLEYQPSQTPEVLDDPARVIEPRVTPEPGPRVSPPTPVLAWDGRTDPREAGVNYFAIVRMRWNDAEAAAAFLSEHGVPSAAVPVSSSVDLARVRANNGLCFVIALEGFPSESFRASKSERDALVVRIKDAGRVWKEQGGTDDFSDGGLWARYDG